MNAGQAITAAMRDQRKRDFHLMRRRSCAEHYNVLMAWLWWGWDINGRGGLGYPGIEYGEH